MKPIINTQLLHQSQLTRSTEKHFQKIVEVVAKFYNRKPSQLMAKGKGPITLSYPRHVAMTLCMELECPYRVCRFFGKSSGSATYAAKNVSNLCSIDKQLEEDFKRVKELVLEALK